jgi:hypothetical protein
MLISSGCAGQGKEAGRMTEAHAALDEVVDDLGDEDEDDLVIIEERSGPATRRWVRFVMPVMVEVDCDDDTVIRVVTLPEEIREDRDDLGHFCVYDEEFIRRHDDDQPQNPGHTITARKPTLRTQVDRLGAGMPAPPS